MHPHLDSTARTPIASMVLSFSKMSNEVVTIEVGETKARFAVHKQLLTSSSPYFRSMFDGAWKESSHSSVPIPLADARVFPHFLDWLYSGHINEVDTVPLGTQTGGECAQCGTRCESRIPDDRSELELEDLSEEDDKYLEDLIETVDDEDIHVDLYLFADKFDVPALREEIVNRYWRRLVSSGAFPTYCPTIKCFRYLPASSKLCRLFVDAFATWWLARNDCICPTEKKLRSKLPKQFIFMLAAELGANTAKSNCYYIRPLCSYHEHPHDESSEKACIVKMAGARNEDQKQTFLHEELEAKRLVEMKAWQIEGDDSTEQEE